MAARRSRRTKREDDRGAAERDEGEPRRRVGELLRQVEAGARQAADRAEVGAAGVRDRVPDVVPPGPELPRQRASAAPRRRRAPPPAAGSRPRARRTGGRRRRGPRPSCPTAAAPNTPASQRYSRSPVSTQRQPAAPASAKKTASVMSATVDAVCTCSVGATATASTTVQRSERPYPIAEQRDEGGREGEEDEAELERHELGRPAREAHRHELEHRDDERVVRVEDRRGRQELRIEAAELDDRRRLDRPDRPGVVRPDRLHGEVDREDRERDAPSPTGRRAASPAAGTSGSGRRKLAARRASPAASTAAQSRTSCHHGEREPGDEQDRAQDADGRGPGDVGDAERPRQIARRRAEADRAQHAVARGEEAGVGEREGEQVARHEAARAR